MACRSHGKAQPALRMRAGISLEQQEYRGRKSSRQAVFEEHDQFQLTDQQGDGDAVQGGSGQAEAAGDASATAAGDGRKRVKREDDSAHAAYQDDADREGEGEELSAGEGEEGRGGEGGVPVGVNGDELHELEAAHRDLQQMEGEALRQLKSKAHKEQAKGLAVRNQQVCSRSSFTVPAFSSLPLFILIVASFKLESM